MPESYQPAELTALLSRWAKGDAGAFDQAADAVLPQMRSIARSFLNQESAQHTLQPTALINEAYLRLASQKELQFASRNHFYALVAHVMRRVLVDHARSVKAQKRGGGAQKVTLDLLTNCSEDRFDEFLHIHEALEELAKVSPVKVRLIELRYFAGLTIEECAEALNLPRSTAHREQRLAEAWLLNRLNP